MHVDLCMLRVVGQSEQQQVSKRIIATPAPLRVCPKSSHSPLTLQAIFAPALVCVHLTYSMCVSKILDVCLVELV